jgi:hypothetical protein
MGQIQTTSRLFLILQWMSEKLMKLRFEVWCLCLYIWSLSLFLSIDWFMACLCWLFLYQFNIRY